jgi:hypothetical protein
MMEKFGRFVNRMKAMVVVMGVVMMVGACGGGGCCCRRGLSGIVSGR